MKIRKNGDVVKDYWSSIISGSLFISNNPKLDEYIDRIINGRDGFIIECAYVNVNNPYDSTSMKPNDYEQYNRHIYVTGHQKKLKSLQIILNRYIRKFITLEKLYGGVELFNV